MRRIIQATIEVGCSGRIATVDDEPIERALYVQTHMLRRRRVSKRTAYLSVLDDIL